jgi:hypothetical protein
MNRTDSSRGKRYFLKTQPILMHMGQSPLVGSRGEALTFTGTSDCPARGPLTTRPRFLAHSLAVRSSYCCTNALDLGPRPDDVSRLP